jgi:hypothetical protein
MTLSRGTSGHISFINRQNVLQAWCDYLMETYQKEMVAGHLRAIYSRYQQRNFQGGICDLVLFSEFRAACRDRFRFGDTNEVLDEAFFDNNIYEAEHDTVPYEGIKDIVWKDSKPHVFQKES